MATTDQLIICEHCDCVYEKVTLAKHQKTLCTRCGGVLQRYNGLTVEQRLALTFTALMLWIFANFYPVMSISLKGLKNSATLWDSVLALSLGPITFIAMVAAIAMIIAPIFQLLLLIWVLGFALAAPTLARFQVLHALAGNPAALEHAGSLPAGRDGRGDQARRIARCAARHRPVCPGHPQPDDDPHRRARYP